MIYIYDSGTERQVKELYVGVDGVARKVKKGYIGVDGVARLCYQNVIDLSSATVTLGAALTYNGSVQTKAVTVVLDGKTLVQGTDYISFSLSEVHSYMELTTRRLSHIIEAWREGTLLSPSSYKSICCRSRDIKPIQIGRDEDLKLIPIAEHTVKNLKGMA